MQKSLAQKRSEYALDHLKVEQSQQKDFATLTQGIPAMVLQNGLGHTLAFLLSKATDKNLKPDPKDKHFVVFQLITGWLKERNILKGTTPSAVMGELSTMKQDNYLKSQTESLKLLEWVKRYAKAGLFVHSAGGDNGTSSN